MNWEWDEQDHAKHSIQQLDILDKTLQSRVHDDELDLHLEDIQDNENQMNQSLNHGQICWMQVNINQMKEAERRCRHTVFVEDMYDNPPNGDENHEMNHQCEITSDNLDD